MKRKVVKWVGIWMAAAAASMLAGCKDPADIIRQVSELNPEQAENIVQTEKDEKETSAENAGQEAGSGADQDVNQDGNQDVDQGKEEEESVGEVDTTHVLLSETIYDTSDTLIGDQYYGYDRSGRQRMMITELLDDKTVSDTLMICEYEDGMQNRYTYYLHADGTVVVSLEVLDAQGILKEYKTLQLSECTETDDGVLQFRTDVTGDTTYEWDEETRTATDGTSYLEYPEDGNWTRNVMQTKDYVQETVREYDSEGNLSRQSVYMNGELLTDNSYTYQIQGDKTYVTCSGTDSSGNRTESENIRHYYTPDVSWEEDIASAYGDLLGTWASRERDCYLVFTAGDVFYMGFSNDEDLTIPYWYGFYTMSSPDDISTDTIYSFSKTIYGDYENLENMDISMDGNTLTFGGEGFTKVSE